MEGLVKIIGKCQGRCVKPCSGHKIYTCVCISKADAHKAHKQERVTKYATGFALLLVGIFGVVGIWILRYYTKLRKSNISHTTPMSTGHEEGDVTEDPRPPWEVGYSCTLGNAICSTVIVVSIFAVVGIVLICEAAILDVHSYWGGC
jgi:ABC-type phosphate transport system permease subunit